VQRLVDRNRPARDAIGQRLAVHEFHHDRRYVRTAFGGHILDVIDRGDARMIERGEHLRLAREAREPIGIARQRRRKHLDCDIATELAVAGAINLAHAAGAEGGHDLVRSEASAGTRDT